MDTLTHALSGALLARATAPKDAPPRSLPRRMAAGFFACAAPDLDFVVSAFGPVAYIELHRGPTHSLLFLPAWAFVFSWILAKILREPAGKTAGWRALYGVTFMGLAAHIAGDLITAYGTMILWPLSDMRPAFGTTFIIDLWFSGIILLGLLFSAFLRNSKAPAIAACVTLCAYVGFQAVLKQRAVDFALDYAKGKGLEGVAVTAQPRPVSSFNWTVFVSDAEKHRTAHINLERDAPVRYQPGDGFVARLDSAYLPLSQAQWETRNRYGDSAEQQAAGRAAWDSDGLAFYRWFAELPAFNGTTEEGRCIWFADLRFGSPGRDWMPFQFGACRETPGGSWRAYERLDSGGKAPL
jgi:inner membrane protein